MIPLNTLQTLNNARAAIGQQRFDLAKAILSELLTMQPQNAMANAILGILQSMQGDVAGAIAHLTVACINEPRNAEMQMHLGIAFFLHGNLQKSLHHLKVATLLDPNSAVCFYNFGKALKAAKQIDASRSALNNALIINPNHELAKICLADICTIVGDISSAVSLLRAVLRQNPYQAEAWHALAALKTYRFCDAESKILHDALQSPQITQDQRILLGFALHKARDDAGDYASAWNVLCEANAAKRSRIQWDAHSEIKLVDSVIWTSKRLSINQKGTFGNKIIFIVSLPRSGSTIVEQILATHRQVEGGNELSIINKIIHAETIRRIKPFPHWVLELKDADWQRMGQAYLEATSTLRSTRPLMTDKSLDNWIYLGCIRKMLPGARIVHVYRNPLETCFSCFRHLFSEGAFYSYDLTDLSEHLVQYYRLMQYFGSVCSDLILDISYEELVKNSEAEIRRILRFAGLEYDANCLLPHRTKRHIFSTASAAQVRAPLSTDFNHTSSYSVMLQPLTRELNSRLFGLLPVNRPGFRGGCLV